MEWLTEILKSPAPVAFVLGAGLVVVWRAFLGKDAAQLAAKDETIRILIEIVKSSSRD